MEDSNGLLQQVAVNHAVQALGVRGSLVWWQHEASMLQHLAACSKHTAASRLLASSAVCRVLCWAHLAVCLCVTCTGSSREPVAETQSNKQCVGPVHALSRL